MEDFISHTIAGIAGGVVGILGGWRTFRNDVLKLRERLRDIDDQECDRLGIPRTPRGPMAVFTNSPAVKDLTR